MPFALTFLQYNVHMNKKMNIKMLFFKMKKILIRKRRLVNKNKHNIFKHRTQNFIPLTWLENNINDLSKVHRTDMEQLSILKV